MIQFVSSASAVAYRCLAKPVLFRQAPDTVHRRMLRLGRWVQASIAARWLLRTAWAYQNPAVLRQTIGGITFENPIGLSAGFDKNIELAPLLSAIGFGLMEGGSITLEPCAGNRKPWFYRLPKTRSIVVHAGLANDGVHAIARRLSRYPKDTFKQFPLNISVAKTNSPQACSEQAAIDDYIGSLQVLQKAALGSMVTLNISCPNTYGGEPFTTPDKLERLLRRVDDLGLACPVFIKMPIDLPWPEFERLLKVIARHQVAGVTIGNLAKDRSKVALKDPLPKDVSGGLSGKPTWELSNDLIRRTYARYGQQLVIIGVGGVFSAKDAYTKILLGASLVELITGMIFEGPQLVGQINRGLTQLLQRDGFNHVSEAVGRDVERA